MKFWLTAIGTASIFWLGIEAQRNDFQLFTLGYFVFCCAAVGLFLLRKNQKNWLPVVLAVGVGWRLLLLWGYPQFSDDFFRFLWDGNLVAHGIHPMAYTPSQIIQNQLLNDEMTHQLFSNLNSPNYFSVYPTLMQSMFWLAVKWSGGDIFGGVFVMKCLIFCAEMGVLFFLLKICTSPLPAAGFALHPLPIFEHVGNCHFEGWMIMGVLACLYFLQKKQIVAAGIALAVAVATKLLPLIFLPAIFFFLNKQLKIKFLATFSLSLAALIFPLCQTDVMANMASSLHLYFHTFEFNASHYYLWKTALTPKFGAVAGQVAAPVLAIFTGVFVMAFCFFNVKKGDFATLLKAMAVSVTVYFLNASTVHPWYLTLPLVLGMLSGWWMPVVWATVVVMSYSHYDGGEFSENWFWILIEYGCLLLVFFGEIHQRSRKLTN